VTKQQQQQTDHNQNRELFTKTLNGAGNASLGQLADAVSTLASNDPLGMMPTIVTLVEVSIRHVLLMALTNPDDLLGIAIRNAIRESVLDAMKER